MKPKALVAAVILVAALLCCVRLFASYTPVEWIKIRESTIELQVGEQMQLTAVGYLKDDVPATAKQLDKLQLMWRTNDVDTVTVTIDENGLLTGENPGVYNVQVYDEKHDLYSAPVLVAVRANADAES